jgi:rod shape determining protein RodA
VKEALKLAGLVLIPALLVWKQPDLGTALTCVAVLLVGVFLAGLHWKYMAAVALAVALALPAGSIFLKDYQRQRLVTFMNPDADPRGAGYHVIQSQIAIGSGGMTGKGFLKGTQSRLRFLPVPYKDFIFSAFAEEQGFVGVVVMLSLYFVLLMRIVQNAQMAPDRAGLYICMGIAALLLCHILVNVGMVAGLMPVTGIPLLFMSFGGSSIWSSFIALGLVNNVRLRRFVN